MTTLAQFRANLRTDLRDPDSKNFSDDDLTRYLREGAAEYSNFFPRERESEFTPDGVSARYPVPVDLMDKDISYLWLVRANGMADEIPGRLGRLRPPERAWEVFAEEIVFNFVPKATETIRMRYAASHEIPDSGDSTIPREDEGLIYLWAQSLGWRKISGADASLSRWTEGQKRDDSPINPHYSILRNDFRRRVQDKLARGRVLTRSRPPRHGRTR